jgi:ketosteroid isomerase-like protein/rubrerythrin
MPASSQTTEQSSDRLIADLNDLLQLDHDAVQAYTVAIDVVRDARYREQLVEYRSDHKRHIEELAGLVRARGGLPIELPHPTAPLKLAVQALGAAPGDSTLLLAFKAVEGQARDKYRRLASSGLPDDAREVVQRGAADEDRHYAWVEQTLRERGVGAGTLPHGVASAVEGLHKLLADPIEGAERQIMQLVGNLLGTSKARTGGAAPSPVDVASQAAGMAAGAAGMGASPGTTPGATASRASMGPDGTDQDAAERAGDALRFTAALHALEETGDVERMVMLFDDTAEVSGPTDMAPHRGQEGARKFWRMYRDSFDEIHSEFEKIVEGGDGTVMLEWTSRGVTATGTPITYRGVSVAEIPDGRVTRFRTYFDTRDLEIGRADLH